MAKQLIHEGSIGFFSGKGKTLCGITIPKAEYKDCLFGLIGPKVTCPGCIAVKRAKKGR